MGFAHHILGFFRSRPVWIKHDTMLHLRMLPVVFATHLTIRIADSRLSDDWGVPPIFEDNPLITAAMFIGIASFWAVVFRIIPRVVKAWTADPGRMLASCRAAAEAQQLQLRAFLSWLASFFALALTRELENLRHLVATRAHDWPPQEITVRLHEFLVIRRIGSVTAA